MPFHSALSLTKGKNLHLPLLQGKPGLQPWPSGPSKKVGFSP
jgi:hypothetical protein